MNEYDSTKFLKELKDHLKNRKENTPKKAKKFLQSAGIIDENGELAEQYR